MLKTLLAAAATLVALTAFADEVRMSAPIEAGSLATDGIEFVAYYVPRDGDLLEVTATWLGEEDAEARRLVLGLAEDDSVGFSLPGHMETLFTFTRTFDAVTVRSEPVAPKFRNASL